MMRIVYIIIESVVIKRGFNNVCLKLFILIKANRMCIYVYTHGGVFLPFQCSYYY